VGGASDGNFTAALGIPTIDGLGAVGAGAHARHEHVRLEALPLRAALLAGLIEHLSWIDDAGRRRADPAEPTASDAAIR
jgi:glutamate carboxypeptidase